MVRFGSSTTHWHQKTENTEEEEEEERKKNPGTTMPRNKYSPSVEKELANKIMELLDKILDIKLKWKLCGACKTEVLDMEGHESVIHKTATKAKSFTKDGVPRLIHCPACLPEQELFAYKESLLDHVQAVHAGDRV